MEQIKRCNKCGIEKPLGEFHNDKYGKYGRRSKCKECVFLYNLQHRQNNKEKYNLRDKKYRQGNKEKIALYAKQYHQENKKAAVEYAKQYYQDNKKERDLKSKQYQQDHKKEHALSVKKYSQTPAAKISRAISGKKIKATRKRELGFNPLNKWFPGCVGHHMNKNDVLFVPAHINKIPHSRYNQASMDRVNRAAIEWLMSQ